MRDSPLLHILQSCVHRVPQKVIVSAWNSAVCETVLIDLSVSVCACLQEEKGLWTFANPSQLYSPDVPEDLAAEAIAALHPMSVKAVADITPALTANWSKSDYEGCMAYVRCTQDVVVPIALQDFMLQQSGANWTIITMDTSHSPFLSRPAELSETIASLATAFTK